MVVIDIWTLYIPAQSFFFYSDQFMLNSSVILDESKHCESHFGGSAITFWKLYLPIILDF
jgi:hypothetical protein